MLKNKALAGIATIALMLAIGAVAGPTANAAGPTTVGLGTAAGFAILAGTAVTGSGVITGDVGVHPGSAVGLTPAMVNGTIHTADALALQAKNDLGTAYVTAAGLPASAAVTAGVLGGTLVGGVYNSGGFTLRLPGSLTLDGQNDPSSVWVFQATSDLITASASTVSFINGAQPCNVFWQVTSSATLGSGSTFAGTILALTSITMLDSVTLNGRALARNGDVTLINDTISRPICAATGMPTATTTVSTAICDQVVVTAINLMPNNQYVLVAGNASANVTTSGTGSASATFTRAQVGSATADALARFTSGVNATSSVTFTTTACASPTATVAAATPTPISRPSPAAGASSTPAAAGTPKVLGVATLPSTGTSADPPIAAVGLILTGAGTALLLRRPRRWAGHAEP